MKIEITKDEMWHFYTARHVLDGDDVFGADAVIEIDEADFREYCDDMRKFYEWQQYLRGLCQKESAS